MKNNKLKIGTNLMAISECEMYFRNGNALIVGKEYKVNGVTENGFSVSSELYEVHEFEINELTHYFRIVKKEMEKEIDNDWKKLGNAKPLNDSEILVYSKYNEKYYIEYVDSEFWIRVSRLNYTHYQLLSKPLN